MDYLGILKNLFGDQKARELIHLDNRIINNILNPDGEIAPFVGCNPGVPGPCGICSGDPCVCNSDSNEDLWEIHKDDVHNQTYVVTDGNGIERVLKARGGWCYTKSFGNVIEPVESYIFEEMKRRWVMPVEGGKDYEV